jgi:hypothetical protein
VLQVDLQALDDCLCCVCCANCDLDPHLSSLYFVCIFPGWLVG